MKEEKLNKIFIIINKYINEYQNSKIIDYYDLFQIDKSLTIEEISTKLKKLKVLLHPDLISYIPEFMQSFYKEVLQEFSNCERVFSNYMVRENYDKNLETSKLKTNNLEKENNSENEEIDEFELDSVMQAIKLTTKKHGFNFTMYNLYLILEDPNIDKWENRFSKEARENLKRVGLEKIKAIIRKFSKNQNSSGEAVLDLYTYLYKNDEEIKSLIFPFEGVCFTTLDKYGLSKLKEALFQLINYQKAEYFTRESGFRKLLIENIFPADIIPIIKIYLNAYKENPFYNYENLEKYDKNVLLELFANKFYEEILKKFDENRKKYY